MSTSRRSNRGRSRYSPKVESLESVRLLSSAASASALASAAIDHATPIAASTHPAGPTFAPAAWDAALEEAHVGTLLAPAGVDSASIGSGLNQLDRYLSRTWSRAGLAPHQQDDATQAVYATLLQNLGRARFDALVSGVGRSGIPDTLGRETPDGPEFSRAIDAAKKRALRERSHHPLDAQVHPVAAESASPESDRRGALHEAITRRLNSREAALVYETLKGSTPAEIARQWGVAPKTVSNEKTRVLAKLRDALGPDLSA